MSPGHLPEAAERVLHRDAAVLDVVHPSRLGYLLDLAPKDLERIIYFAAYVITRIDGDRRHKELPEIEAQLDQEKTELDAERDEEVKRRPLYAISELLNFQADGENLVGSPHPTDQAGRTT